MAIMTVIAINRSWRVGGDDIREAYKAGGRWDWSVLKRLFHQKSKSYATLQFTL